MNNTIKTSVAASLAVLVSFAMLFVYLNYASVNPVDVSSEKFSFAAADSGEKRVFLLGSSYVERLNATYIKQYLSENGLQQFQVYNVAKNGAGNPSQQIAFLDSMISSHPSVVVYGLGFRELGYKPYTDGAPNCAPAAATPFSGNNGTSFSTPTVQDAAAYIQKIFPMPTDYFANIADPKHVTVDLLKSHFGDNSTTAGNDSTSGAVAQDLFEKRGPLFTTIMSLDEINKPLSYTVHVCPDDMNNELEKLNKMVTEFKKNNINMILFVPPFSSSYLNAVGTDGINTFLSALQKYADENNLKLYDLHDKYVDLDIWADAQHVAQNPKVIIYSDDLAKIILTELKSFTNLRTVDTSDHDLSYRDFSYADLRDADLSSKNMTGTHLAYSNLYRANVNGTILVGADLSHAYMHDLNLSGKDLTDANLLGADLTNAKLYGVNLADKNLTGANLDGVDLSHTDLTGSVLTEANLLNANLTGVDLAGKDLTGANLAGVNLSEHDLTGTILTGVNLDYSNLKDVDLTGKNLTGTSLKGVYLADHDLTGTILIGTNLAYANIRGNDLTGKNLTKAFLFDTNLYEADLGGADLSGDNLRKTVLTGANLGNVKLHNADLSGNNLTNTELVGADLSNAILSGTNLSDKDLTGTILAGANLVNANLTGADLSGKDLMGTNLKGAHMDYAILSGVNLGMKNLEGTSLQGANLAKATLWKAKLIGTNLVNADLSHSDLRNAIFQNSNLTDADLTGANLSGANLSGTIITGAILVGANMVNANLTGIDLSQAVTSATSSSETLPAGVIADFQSENGWIKQSLTGDQSYDAAEFINGSQSMKLVTVGNGSATVTHSNIFKPTLNLNHTIVNAWIKLDNPSKVKELWMYFSSDGFKSSWYTSKIPITTALKSGDWAKVSIDPTKSTISGSPNLSAIDRIQLRIDDDSTGPVILHINQISIQKEAHK